MKDIIGSTWEKAIKFWPAIIFLAGAYVGFAKLQWQSAYFERRLDAMEREVKDQHDKLVRWEGARERNRGR